MKYQKQSLHKPPWLKIKPRFGPIYNEMKALIKQLGLHTVCQEAGCPNIGECFSARTATFMILGDKCTRNCRFCGVNSGQPLPPDLDEPARVAQAVKKLNLRFAVITSVTRDDLADGGAAIFVDTVKQIRKENPDCKIELLIPDFTGNHRSLDIILNVKPDVLAHNIETVPILYNKVRPQADYNHSLDVLRYISEQAEDIIIKSGMMVGLGETFHQIEDTLKDVARVGCQIFTVGQYLAPSKNHLPVERYYTPEEFELIKKTGENSGIKHLESGPLIRSSYMAHRQTEKFLHKIKSA